MSEYKKLRRDNSKATHFGGGVRQRYLVVTTELYKLYTALLLYKFDKRVLH